jgi:hypothetical protein
MMGIIFLNVRFHYYSFIYLFDNDVFSFIAVAISYCMLSSEAAGGGGRSGGSGKGGSRQYRQTKGFGYYNGAADPYGRPPPTSTWTCLSSLADKAITIDLCQFMLRGLFLDCLIFGSTSCPFTTTIARNQPK